LQPGLRTGCLDRREPLRERFERECARRDWQDRVMAITREIATSLRDPAANDRGGVSLRHAAAG